MATDGSEVKWERERLHYCRHCRLGTNQLKYHEASKGKCTGKVKWKTAERLRPSQDKWKTWTRNTKNIPKLVEFFKIPADEVEWRQANIPTGKHCYEWTPIMKRRWSRQAASAAEKAASSSSALPPGPAECPPEVQKGRPVPKIIPSRSRSGVRRKQCLRKKTE